ncbi:hypothetical protein [Avibacterium paragallinarum]|uniref:Uncharacterized protein n=1 Tax=Avibacterium paragallinarum TaxID=728 RepID=A0ABU7QSK8_AVIPA|nr:hypothetical protein [Avibacterium paragallinarum]
MIYSNYRHTFNPLDLSVDEYLECFTEPKQATHIIGYFPKIDRSLTSGEIWLYRGKHKYKYSLDHIWYGRKKELIKRKVFTVRQLINFLIKLIDKRTPIYPEPEHYKAAVIKSSRGALIVKNINDEYSTVTLLLATPAKPLPVQNRWGNQVIGSIKRDCKII